MPYKDPEQKRAHSAAYYQTHKEELKEYDKVRNKKWREANKEKKLASNKSWFEAHPNYQATHMRDRRQTPEYKAYTQTEEYKELAKKHTRTYLLKLANELSTTTRGLKAKLKAWSLLIREKDNYRCTICKCTDNLHAHHILPKQYFRDLFWNKDNGETLCKDCHVGRHMLLNDLKKIYEKTLLPYGRSS